MKRFIPCLALIALVALVGCSGDSPSAEPVPTVVPTIWGIESLTVSDTTPFVGSPVLVDVEVTRDGSAAPDGTIVEFLSSGPGSLFGFTSGVLTKGDLVLNEDVSVVTEDGVASVFFAVVPLDENDDPAGSYTIQARVHDVLTQTSVAYATRPTTDTFQLISVNPTRGPYTGEQVVTLYGVNISTPVEVYFIVNGRPYEAEVVDTVVGDDGWIQVLTPVFTGQDWSIEQTADIRVLVSAGTTEQQTDTLFGAYTLLQQSQTAGPVIFGVAPNSGRSSGGEVVSILGQGFDFSAANMVVGFTDSGGTARLASILAVAPDGTQIQVETPLFSTLPLDQDDPQDVEVTTPNGSDTLADGFIVLADEPQPDITSISPTSGPLDGGTLVTIFGSGFQVPMQVWFGDLTALDVNVFNDTTPADNDRITCVTPDYSQQDEVPPVTVNVRAVSMTSGKDDTLPSAFTYGDELYISGNSPSEGGLGDLVIIYGSGFEDPLQVFLGGEQMEVVSVSGTELVVRIPDDLGTQCGATSGAFTVTLLESNRTTAGGNFTIRGNTPLVLSVDPVILQEDGAVPSNVTPDDITINGQQFAEEVLVSIGTYVVPSTDVDRVSDTTIDVFNLPGPDDLGIIFDSGACVTGGGAPGQRQVATSVSVTVTNFPGDCSDTLLGAIVVEPFDQTCVVAPDIQVAFNGTFPGDTEAGSCSATPQTVQVTNTNVGSTLTVFSMTLGGEFYFDNTATSQNEPSFTVAGGATVNRDVYFCPSASSTGTLSGSLSIFSDDPDESFLTYNLSGTVTPPNIQAALTPSGNFGSIAVGFCTPAPGYDLSITNTVANSTLDISIISTNGQFFIGDPALTNQSVTNISVAGLATVNYEIYFCADAVGTFNGTLSISSNDPDQPTTTFNLTGTGIP